MVNLFFNNEVRNILVGFILDNSEQAASSIIREATELSPSEHTPVYATFLGYCKDLARRGVAAERQVFSEGFLHLHPVIKEYYFSIASGKPAFRPVARLALKFAVESGRSMFDLLGKEGARKGHAHTTDLRLRALDTLLDSPLTCCGLARQIDAPRNTVGTNLEQMARHGLVDKPDEKPRKNRYRLVKSPRAYLEGLGRTKYFMHPNKGKVLRRLIAISKNGFSPGGKYSEFDIPGLHSVVKTGGMGAIKGWAKRLVDEGYAVLECGAFKKQERKLTELGMQLAGVLRVAALAMEDDECAAELAAEMDSFFNPDARKHYCTEGFRIYYSSASIHTKQGIADALKEGVLEIAQNAGTFTANDAVARLGCRKGTLTESLKRLVDEGILDKRLVGRSNHYSLNEQYRQVR